MGLIELAVLILFGIFAYKKVNQQGEIANWSWRRVTSPLWIYAIFVLVMGVVSLGIFGVALFAMPPA